MRDGFLQQDRLVFEFIRHESGPPPAFATARRDSPSSVLRGMGELGVLDCYDTDEYPPVTTSPSLGCIPGHPSLSHGRAKLLRFPPL
jgi:hypothetical protein